MVTAMHVMLGYGFGVILKDSHFDTMLFQTSVKRTGKLLMKFYINVLYCNFTVKILMQSYTLDCLFKNSKCNKPNVTTCGLRLHLH